MLSKELLSVVLGKGIRSFDISPNKNLIQYVGDKASVSNFTAINIHEFAHKCKEWAMSEGWYLSAWFTKNEGAYCDGIKPPNNEEIHTEAKEEPEAIFQACQWILDNKE